jgi:hypothetical protein
MMPVTLEAVEETARAQAVDVANDSQGARKVSIAPDEQHLNIDPSTDSIRKVYLADSR